MDGIGVTLLGFLEPLADETVADLMKLAVSALAVVAVLWGLPVAVRLFFAVSDARSGSGYFSLDYSDTGCEAIDYGDPNCGCPRCESDRENGFL